MAFGQRGAADPPFGGASDPPPAGRSPPSALLAMVVWEIGLVAAAAGFLLWALPQKAAIEAESAGSTRQVVTIINQPVAGLPRTSVATEYFPGWFHPGALTPDFATVDVRKTQELFYAKNAYVTSDLNPTEMFPGDEVEFNAMTKMFYADRTLPKKRLSEDEMLKINDLYRVIARSDDAVGRWRGQLLTLAGLVLILAVAPVFIFRGRV